MAKDDYFVIVYKLLKYLYDCLKNSECPETEILTPEFFGIENVYWTYIIENLGKEGYINGVHYSEQIRRHSYLKDAYLHSFCEITPKGLGYLMENSMLQKAKKYARNITSVIAKNR